MEPVVLVFVCIHKLFTRPGGNNREDWRCTGHAMATKQKLITSIQLCKLKKVQTINSDLLMLPFFFFNVVWLDKQYFLCGILH